MNYTYLNLVVMIDNFTCATLLSGVRLRLLRKVDTINSNNTARSGISLSGFSSKNFSNGNSSDDLIPTKILGK